MLQELKNPQWKLPVGAFIKIFSVLYTNKNPAPLLAHAVIIAVVYCAV
jgi:hypothetical protein